LKRNPNAISALIYVFIFCIIFEFIFKTLDNVSGDTKEIKTELRTAKIKLQLQQQKSKQM